MIGAGYGFLVLATLGLATIAFALVLIPFLVVIAGTRLRLGAAAVGVAAGLGFIVGFLLAGRGFSCPCVAAHRPASWPPRPYRTLSEG